MKRRRLNGRGRCSIVGSIWLIAEVYRDADNYRQERVMLDRGYFLTEEAALEYIADISDSWADFCTVEVDINHRVE